MIAIKPYISIKNWMSINRHACKSATVLECTSTDDQYGIIRYRHARQAGALKCISPDAHHAVRDRHARQAGAAGERRIIDVYHSFSKFNARSLLQCIVSKHFIASNTTINELFICLSIYDSSCLSWILFASIRRLRLVIQNDPTI